MPKSEATVFRGKRLILGRLGVTARQFGGVPGVWEVSIYGVRVSSSRSNALLGKNVRK